MSTENLYNQWSSTYDEVENKTRDLEKIAGQKVLSAIDFDVVLELGCGTGKNTEWLSKKATDILAVDLSEQMMARAKEKIKTNGVRFKQADITKPWNFQSRLRTSVSSHLFCVAGVPSTELYAVMIERAPAFFTADSNGGKCSSSSCRVLRSIG